MMIGIGKFDRGIGIGIAIIDNIDIDAYRYLSMPTEA